MTESLNAIGGFSATAAKRDAEVGADGRVVFTPKRPWRDGTKAILLEPQELIKKLAALVPEVSGPLRTPQRPFQLGLRFSAKARGPSLRSSPLNSVPTAG